MYQYIHSYMSSVYHTCMYISILTLSFGDDMGLLGVAVFLFGFCDGSLKEDGGLIDGRGGGGMSSSSSSSEENVRSEGSENGFKTAGAGL